MNSEQTSKNILTYINDGMSGFEKLFSRLNLSFGVSTKSGAIDKDQQRIKNMNNKFQETVKMKKKKLRSVKKGYIDKEKHNEGRQSYLTGNFWCVLLYFMFKPFFVKIDI